MIRNNITALFIHAFTGILFWFLSGVITDLMINWGIFHEYITNGVFLLVSIIGLLCYHVLGKLFLATQLNNWKSLLSVSCVSIIGLLIWIYCAFFTDGGWAWLFYGIYNATFYHLMSFVPSGSAWGIIWISLLPSFILWLGMKKKKKRNNEISQMEI
jgi:hypothetical protein